MTRKVYSLIAAATLIPGWFSPTLAQEVPASAVSCHFVARVNLNIDTNTFTGIAQVAGYITDIPGIDSASLFSGTPWSEKTAFLTFRSDIVKLSPVQSNGVVNLFHVSSGTFNIYHNPKPHGDWSNPDTFSGDAPVGTMGVPTAVHLMRDESLFYQTDTLARHDVTEHLVSSTPFVLNGQKYDLGTFVPAGFTLYETYSNTPVGTPITGYPSGTIPGAGNCAAIAATATEGDNQQ